MQRKGQEISVTVIVVAAVALIVLVVLIAIFTGKLGTWRTNVGLIEKSTCDSGCKSRDYVSGTAITAGTCKDVRISGFFKDLGDNDECCCKKV